MTSVKIHNFSFWMEVGNLDFSGADPQLLKRGRDVIIQHMYVCSISSDFMYENMIDNQKNYFNESNY